MEEKEIYLKIMEVAARIFKVEIEKLNLECSSKDIEEWDSLTHLIFMLEIQRIFGLSFTTEQISQVISLRDIYEIILRA